MMALTKVSKGLISTDTVFEVDALGGKYGSSSAPVTITVTVGTKTAAHPYNGDGSSSAYFLDGLEAPAIYLNGADNVTSDSGYYYKFDQSDSTISSHPLRFYLDADKTTAYTTGVTTSGTPGSSGAYTQIDVDEDTPSILYYQCSSHAYMGNYALVPASNVINHTEALISMPTATTTLVGTDTTDTLTNKTLTSPKINEDVAVTSTATEINILDGVTASTTELNILDGVTASTTEINILDGVTASTAEINKLDGVTATTAEINYLDITTLGASEASKVLTANASGIVTFNKAITEQSVALTSGTSVTLDISQGSVFTITLAHNISTFTWSNPATSGDVSAFVLKVTQDGTGSRTIAFPAAVDFAGGTAPTLSTGANDVDVFVFFTVDAGTTYFGFTAGQDLS